MGETVAAASAAEHGETLRELGSTKHRTEENACGAPDKHFDPGGAHTAAVPARRPNPGERKFCINIANVHYGTGLALVIVSIILVVGVDHLYHQLNDHGKESITDSKHGAHRCVNRAGVKVIESRDERGCERFSNRQLKAEWLPFRNAFTPSMPQPCLSLTFVSVHASPSEVLLFEYLTRVLTAYGERARVNVTDTWLRWNASTMPEWTDTELHRIQLAAKRLSPHSATKQK
ncbi:hypothetical protein MRX96_030160 [Rhipicephalus microplus]